MSASRAARNINRLPERRQVVVDPSSTSDETYYIVFPNRTRRIRSAPDLGVFWLFGRTEPPQIWGTRFWNVISSGSREVLSDTASLISGVVQGSGIGALVFLVYINELAVILDNQTVCWRRKIACADS